MRLRPRACSLYTDFPGDLIWFCGFKCHLHGGFQVGLSRHKEVLLVLVPTPRVPQVNTCSRGRHHPQPASFSPPQFESTLTIHLLRLQFRGFTLILLLPQPPSSSSANPVSSTLKVYPEHAFLTHPHSLDYDHGPLCPPSLPRTKAAEDPAQLSGNQLQCPRPPLPTSAPSPY